MQNFLFDWTPKVYISKTDFIHGITCPYTWYLKKLKGLKGIVDERMVDGTILHSLMKDINGLKDDSKLNGYIKKLIEKNKKFEVELNNILNFLEDRKSKGLKVFPEYSEFKVEVTIGKFVLQGIVDAIYVDGENVEIFEYKSSFYRSYEDLFEEVAFYSYLFSRFMGVNVSRMGLFSFSTGEVRYKEFIDKEVSEKIFSFLDLLDRGDFKAFPSKENCSFCVFRKNCEFSVV